MYSLMYNNHLRQNMNLTKILNYSQPKLKEIYVYCPCVHKKWSTSDCCCPGSSSTGSTKHKVIYKPYVKPCFMDHDHKNMGLRRPMSPHLTIYGPTLPAMTSIAQRITGSILTFYALMISGGTLFLANGVDTYISIIQSLNLSENLIIALKFALGLPFAYHYFCGIRFCAWNAGKWLSMKEVYNTAKLSFVLMIIVGAGFAFL